MGFLFAACFVTPGLLLQGMGPLKEEMGQFPEAEEASSDSWQKVILGEIKKEEEEDVSLEQPLQQTTESMVTWYPAVEGYQKKRTEAAGTHTAGPEYGISSGNEQVISEETENSLEPGLQRRLSGIADWPGSQMIELGEVSENSVPVCLAKGRERLTWVSQSHPQTRGVGVEPRPQDERLKKCLDCGKGFVWRSELIEHQRSHTGERPYSCSYCGKSFSRKSYIIKHERIHTGEKPYICSHCGKGFISKSDLIKHERTHTGEKPYLCADCGRRFSRKQFLVTHRRTHTGEKPYKCSACGKSFSQRTCLVIHERAHTGEKPFQCLVCGKSFGRRDILMTHHKLHTREKAFQPAEWL